MQSTTNTLALSFPINMGEEHAFDRIFRNYYPALCDFAERFLKNKEDAEEAVESLFANLWKRKEVFQDVNHVRSFLYRSVYNNSLNILRTNKRQISRENYYGMQSNFTEESYLNNLLRAELIGMIYREIESLPSHYAKVLRMSYQDGLKNEEIAEQLGLSLQTVKNYKTKGLSIIKGKLPNDAWTVLYFGAVLSIFSS